MATILNTTQVYNAADVVTHTNLNQIISGSTFVAGVGGATDDVTLEVDSGTGSLQVKDDGITTNKIGDNAVTTDKILNSNVTKSKIEDVADMKVLGNTSGSATAPQEVSVLDEDDMSSDSATALATQQSIKAYVDDGVAPQIGVGQTWQSVTRDLSGTSYTNSTGKPIMVKGEFSGNTDSHIVTITVTPSGGSPVSITFAISTNSGGGVASNGSIIIPNNTEYSFSTSGAGAITSHQFHELR
jgi:hypothetical protein